VATVTGNNLDSVAEPRIRIIVVVSRVHDNVLSTTSNTQVFAVFNLLGGRYGGFNRFNW